jgi:Cadherin domain
VTHFFSLTPGKDDVAGLSDNYNAFQLTPATLQSTDTIVGAAAGGFIDLVVVTAPGTIAAPQFSGVTNIEELNLSNGGSNVTLTDGLVSGTSIGYFAIADSEDNDTVDASAVSATPIVFFSRGGDSFSGGHGNDALAIASADLTAAETIQAGAGIDNLYLTTSGTVSASAFAHVTGIEGLVLANGANNVTLTDALTAASGIGYFAVAGGTGNDTVDASGIGNSIPIAFLGSAGGDDTFTGGSENDCFLFEANQLTAADTVVGGGGSDTLWITAAGTTDASSLAHVSGIEGVFLQNGGTFHFANGITIAGNFAAVGSAAADTFDAAAITAYGVTFDGKGGADTLLGGGGDDVFNIGSDGFAAIDGNGGIDRLSLTTDQPSFNLTANAAKIHDIEVVSMLNVDHGSVTLSGADIALVSGDNALYVVGDSGDSYEAGTGYTQIASGVTNDAVAPGHMFYEFQYVTGSLLYVDADFFGTVVTDGPVGAEPENSPVNHVVYSDHSTFPPGTTVTHTIFGPDAGLFNIDATTDDVTFKASPDFENPLSQSHTNSYAFSVATSTDRAVPATFQVSGALVTDVNDNAPVFTSATSASTSENVATSTAVYSAHATDADGTAANNTVIYSMAAGIGDNDLFSIDSAGNVRFKVSPDYEAPTDVNHDNQYDITVLASDGLASHQTSLNVAIMVSDVLLA